MRIGLIRMRYSPYGGAETFLKRFIDELLRRGHAIDVFSTDWPSQEGVAVHRVSTWGPSFLRPLLFAAGAAKAVEKAAPDFVISLERTYCQDIYRAGDGCHKEWLAKRASTVSAFKRLLIRVNPLHIILLYLEARLFSSPRLKRVAANSRMVQEDIMRHYQLPKERICVIYNGLEFNAVSSDTGSRRAEVRQELGVPQHALMLLFVGSGFERKGLLYAVRALGKLQDKCDMRLVVIGKGKTHRYHAEAKRLGIADKVIFKGPAAGVSRFYEASDIFVLPTIYEPFSNACLEAMAAGVPVITSKANGASEILAEAGYNAIIDDPADSAALSTAIEALTDDAKRKQASEAVRKIASRFTIGRNVDEFLKLINEESTGA